MIPESIHQLWIDPRSTRQPRSPPPSDIEENCRAWQQLHPAFDYKLWSLDQVMQLARISDRDDVCRAIQACQFPAMQADLARLFLLELAGGFWLDLKLSPRRAFLTTLTANDLVVTEHFPKDNLPVPNGFLINSFIGAQPYHPCISAALNGAVSNVNRRMAGSIFYIAGSPVLLDAVNARPDRGKYRMLDHQIAWGELFEIRGGSYNAHGMHWSERQEREPVYKTEKVNL